MRAPFFRVLAYAGLALAMAGCASSAAAPSATVASPAPTIVTVTPAPTVKPTPTRAPTLTPTETPTTIPDQLANIDLNGGQTSATQIAIAEGSLGMTLAAYIKSYNRNLDQGQYPITTAPTKVADQVYQVTPDGTTYSTLIFVVNSNGTVRSVTALSTAKSITDPVDHGFAQLESLVVFATVASAANANLTIDQNNNLLGAIGFVGGQDFGSYAVETDYLGLRYFLVETADGTDMIIRSAA